MSPLLIPAAAMEAIRCSEGQADATPARSPAGTIPWSATQRLLLWPPCHSGSTFPEKSAALHSDSQRSPLTHVEDFCSLQARVTRETLLPWTTCERQRGPSADLLHPRRSGHGFLHPRTAPSGQQRPPTASPRRFCLAADAASLLLRFAIPRLRICGGAAVSWEVHSAPDMPTEEAAAPTHEPAARRAAPSGTGAIRSSLVDLRNTTALGAQTSREHTSLMLTTSTR